MGVVFLMLFAATLFILYIAVRRSWGDTLTNGSVGAILSILWVILYALVAEKTSTAQAIFAGVVTGLGFAVVVVIIALFFRANQPSSDVRLVSETEQEELTREGRDDQHQTTE